MNLLRLKSKKGFLDIPLAILMKLLVGLMTMILVILPLLSLFFTDDYNKDVALDVTNSLYDFLDYKINTYNDPGGAQCVDIFKLEYLSNPQILHDDYDNYVITITGDRNGFIRKIGLINYDDFEKLQNGDDLGNDFDSFNNLNLNSDVNIKMNFFNFDCGISQSDDCLEDEQVPNEIYAIFLVPSVKLESLFERSFTGDSRAGYYVFYLRDDYDSDGKLNLMPEENTYRSLLNAVTQAEIPSGAKNYHIGFFRKDGFNFGIVKKHPTQYSPLQSCRLKPQEIATGELADPSINTRGISCEVQTYFNNVPEDRYRTNIYWDNDNGRGYQCGTNYESQERDFCREFLDNEANSFIFDENTRRNDYLERIRERLESDTELFFRSIFEGAYEVSYNLECSDVEDADDLIISPLYGFDQYFEKIPDDEVRSFSREAISNEENIFFAVNNPVEQFNCKFNEDADIVANRWIGDHDYLCNFAILYKKTPSSEAELIYYIKFENDENLEKSGFYKFRDLNFLRLVLNEQTNTEELLLGIEKLPFRESNLFDEACGFFKWAIPFWDCGNLETLEIDFRSNFFTDVSYFPFQIYTDKSLVISDRLENDFDIYFKEIDGNRYKSGTNNAKLDLNGKEYVLDPTELRVSIKDIVGRDRFSPDDLVIKFDLIINGQNLETVFEFTSRRLENSYEVHFPQELFNSIDEPFEYQVSFEQVLMSYFLKLENINSFSRIVENKDFKYNIVGIGPEGSSAPREYLVYLTTNNEESIPIITRSQFENGQSYYSLVGARLFSELEEIDFEYFDLGNIDRSNEDHDYLIKNIVYPTTNNGNIEIDVIPEISLTFDEIDSILE